MPIKQRRPCRRDLISTGATTAETVEQLALEVETLKCLETMALGVLRSSIVAEICCVPNLDPWGELDSPEDIHFFGISTPLSPHALERPL